MMLTGSVPWARQRRARAGPRGHGPRLVRLALTAPSRSRSRPGCASRPRGRGRAHRRRLHRGRRPRRADAGRLDAQLPARLRAALVRLRQRHLRRLRHRRPGAGRLAGAPVPGHRAPAGGRRRGGRRRVRGRASARAGRRWAPTSAASSRSPRRCSGWCCAGRGAADPARGCWPSAARRWSPSRPSRCSTGRAGPDRRSHLGDFVQRILDGDAVDVVSRKAVASAETVVSGLGIGSVAGRRRAVAAGPALRAAACWSRASRPCRRSCRRVLAHGRRWARSLNDGGISVWLTGTAMVAITDRLVLPRPRPARGLAVARARPGAVDVGRAAARPPVGSARGGHGRERGGDPGPGAALGRAGAQGGRVPPDPGDPRPAALVVGAGHVLGDVVRALLVQVVQGAPAPLRRAQPGHPGRPAAGRHRRERRRGRHRPGLRGHLQDRVPQPPQLRRAPPGRGDRRRRHRPRHPRHGRPARSG